MQHNCPHLPGEVFSTVSTLVTFVCLQPALTRLSSATLSTSRVPCLRRDPDSDQTEGNACPLPGHFGMEHLSHSSVVLSPDPHQGAGPEGKMGKGQKDPREPGRRMWEHRCSTCGHKVPSPWAFSQQRPQGTEDIWGHASVCHG